MREETRKTSISKQVDSEAFARYLGFLTAPPLRNDSLVREN